MASTVYETEICGGPDRRILIYGAEGELRSSEEMENTGLSYEFYEYCNCVYKLINVQLCFQLAYF